MYNELDNKVERVEALEADKLTFEVDLERAKQRPQRHETRNSFGRIPTPSQSKSKHNRRRDCATGRYVLRPRYASSVRSSGHSQCTFSGGADCKIEYRIWMSMAQRKGTGQSVLPSTQPYGDMDFAGSRR